MAPATRRRPGVLLDRDGTLIDVVRDEETGSVSVAYHPAHLRFLPGVIEGLQRLHAAGFVLAIATNQPGPAKGQFSRAAVERTHAALVSSLAELGIPIAAVAVCWHHPEGGPGGDPQLIQRCACRKPKPGLLLDLVERLELAAEQSWMLGDSAGDAEAANAAGLHAGLVFPTNRCELCPLRGGPSVQVRLSAPRFDELVEQLLAQHERA